MEKTSFELKEVRHLVTANCNLCCRHCYNAAGSNKSLVARKYTQEEINSFYHHYKPEVVSATGGEPLLEFETVKQIARALSEYGGELELVTNAYLLDEAKIDELSSINKNLSFQISIDGLEETHNKIRGNDLAFEKAISGMRLALSKGFKVKARLTLSEDNFDETFKVIDLLDSFNDTNLKLIVRPVVNYGRAKENNVKSVPHTEKELSKMFNDYAKVIKVSVTERCGYCTNSCAVDYKGDMYECCYLIGNDNYRIGNILDDLDSLYRNVEFLNHKGMCYIKDNRNI